LYAAYLDFYNTSLTREQMDRVWLWLHDEANEVEGLVAVSASGDVVGLAHYRHFARPSSASIDGCLDDLFVDPAVVPHNSVSDRYGHCSPSSGVWSGICGSVDIGRPATSDAPGLWRSRPPRPDDHWTDLQRTADAGRGNAAPSAVMTEAVGGPDGLSADLLTIGELLAVPGLDLVLVAAPAISAVRCAGPTRPSSSLLASTSGGASSS